MLPTSIPLNNQPVSTNQPTSIPFNQFIPPNQSTPISFNQFIPPNQSTPIPLNQFIPPNQSTPIPLNQPMPTYQSIPPNQPTFIPSNQPILRNQPTSIPSNQPIPPIPPSSFRITPPVNNNPTTADTLFKKSDGKVYKKKYTLNEQYHSPALASQLVQLEKYWTQPNNLLRKDPMVNQVTHKKRRERILCYMGWLIESNRLLQPDLTLFDVSKSAENRERYELYLDYLKNERKLNAGTIIEHFTAAVYALKYLYARYKKNNTD
jgi:hypothetical protein